MCPPTQVTGNAMDTAGRKSRKPAAVIKGTDNEDGSACEPDDDVKSSVPPAPSSSPYASLSHIHTFSFTPSPYTTPFPSSLPLPLPLPLPLSIALFGC